MNSYEIDFAAWADEQARLLEQHEFNELDLANLIEEVRDLGKSQRRAIASYLTVLLTHLLKWQYQPQLRQYASDGSPKGSWAGSIVRSRLALQQLLEENPSLRDYPQQVLERSYKSAVKVASAETGIKDFPKQCPYQVTDILNDEFWTIEQ